MRCGGRVSPAMREKSSSAAARPKLGGVVGDHRNGDRQQVGQLEVVEAHDRGRPLGCPNRAQNTDATGGCLPAKMAVVGSSRAKQLDSRDLAFSTAGEPSRTRSAVIGDATFGQRGPW